MSQVLVRLKYRNCLASNSYTVLTATGTVVCYYSDNCEEMKGNFRNFSKWRHFRLHYDTLDSHAIFVISMISFPLHLKCKYHEPPFMCKTKLYNHIKLLAATPMALSHPQYLIEGLIAWCLTKFSEVKKRRLTLKKMKMWHPTACTSGKLYSIVQK